MSVPNVHAHLLITRQCSASHPPAPDGPTSAHSSPGTTTPELVDRMRLGASVCLSTT